MTYGNAELWATYKDTGEVEKIGVNSADPVIRINIEVLTQAKMSFSVDGDGLLWLAGDHRYRYRPVRFECPVDGLPPGLAAKGVQVLICERVVLTPDDLLRHRPGYGGGQPEGEKP